jgi:hypothetical protein
MDGNHDNPREAPDSPDQDIRPVLAGWPYRPNDISVRKITGQDGRQKIQLRVDLGLLQMEMTGRPDGLRPHGLTSLLHWHKDRLEKYRRRSGTDVGFLLTPEECESIREEALLFYQRYLSLFVLQDYRGVERDTARNIEAADLCRRYATEVADRLALEQYRPYILMMNRRAAALRLLQQGKRSKAIEAIDEGIRLIQQFFEEYKHAEAAEESREIGILRTLRHEIADKKPANRLESLQQQLHDAVQEERYEEAASLRDQINMLIERRRSRNSEKSGA